MKYRVEILFLLPAAYRFPLLRIFAPDCILPTVTLPDYLHAGRVIASAVPSIIHIVKIT
jgi:hypothetical protein